MEMGICKFLKGGQVVVFKTHKRKFPGFKDFQTLSGIKIEIFNGLD